MPAVKPAAIRAHRRGAGRSGAALHEPRLCRRHGRDGGAALAEAATASPKMDDATIRISEAVERLAPGVAARRAARARRRCSTISTRAGASRCSSSRPARCGSGSARGSPSRRWPRPSGSTSMRSRRSGTASPRLTAELFDWAEGARRAADRARRARCSARSCSPIRSRRPRSRSTIMPPNGNGTASASSSSTPAARPGSTAAPATTSRTAFPTSPRRSARRACSTASCWCEGAAQGRRCSGRRRGELQRAPAAARAQERRQKMLRRLSRLRPALRHPVRRRRGSARASLARTPRAARSASRRSLDPERFDLSQLIDADDFEQLEDLRAGARDASIEGVMLKRRDSPYVGGPPRRPVVQMEARSADRRLRADVCPARLAASARSFYSRLHLRLLDRGRASCSPSARPISASPTRS